VKVLLIEDEFKIAAFIQKGLSENGDHITVAYDGHNGIKMATQEDFDVIILDIMLPGIGGLEVCTRLRANAIDTPILLLTALGTIDDKVTGLQHGADDYLTKPFHFKELIARLQALTRRRNYKPVQQTDTLTAGDLQLDRLSKTATRDGVPISLTAKEYAILEVFMANTNRVLSRTYIADEIWGYGNDNNSNVIDVYVNYLRNKIDKGFDTKLIHTMVGMGYIMKIN
jgi:two-component system, OmpR family, copper resistance phosphate regulon response regulator CusR